MRIGKGAGRLAVLPGGGLLVLSALAFALYSARFGLRGLGLDLSDESYLFTPQGTFANVAIFSHMLLGALAMVLAPLQLVSRLRRRHPRLHRITGRAVILAGLLVALGGLAYIALRGTIAGPLMDAGFALYGLLLMAAALQALRHARARDFGRHEEWALRLLVLLMGSLIFRLHYVIWFALTGGLWSDPGLTGGFDQVQYVAFYLPYLALLEMWLRRRRAAA